MARAPAQIILASVVALLCLYQRSSCAQQTPSVPSVQLPLPSLPKVATRGFSEPAAETLRHVDELLERLCSADPDQNQAAAREVLEAQKSWVDSIYFRLNKIADRADRAAMKRVLLNIRRRTRERLRKAMRAAGDKSDVLTPDYLQMVTGAPRPKSKAWRDLVQVLGLSRMLVHVGTVEATRALIHVFVRFDFLRIDTQLQLKALGERALAALIEARQHKAAKISRWAMRQLDALGKSIPSEAVQTEDHQVLADVLRAFGRIRDPDAARIVISFANSERSQIREAARQAVALMGETANWQLRDTYEATIGKKPPRDWSWERTARELFREFDGMRVSELYETFKTGKKAYEEKKFRQMYEAYNRVLANLPLFEQRREMVAGYVTYATDTADKDPDSALDAIARAERLSDAPGTPSITSLKLTLQAEALIKRGIVDSSLLTRALEIDPNNDRARRVLAEATDPSAAGSPRRRYFAALAIAVAAAVAIFVIVVTGLRRGPAGAQPEPKSSS